MIKITKQLIDEYGLVLRFWLGTDLNIVVSNPDDIKVIIIYNISIFFFSLDIICSSFNLIIRSKYEYLP